MAGKKTTVLGKALGDLLSDSLAETTDAVDGQSLQQLNINQIQCGKYQPRKDIDPTSLLELSSSIRAQGVVQPIIVRALDSGVYEIIAGERRWRAAKQAGLTEIPAIIKEMDDETALVVALVENIQRQDLNPLEEALALQRLVEEFDLTHQELSGLVGKSRTVVTNLLRILTLPEPVQNMLKLGQLEVGHAKILVTLEPKQQLFLAEEVFQRNLSVRQTEQRVREIQKARQATTSKAKKQLPPEVSTLEKRLAEQIGKKVNIQHKASGKGKLVIHYDSLEDLDRVFGLVTE